jgi:hypothetical protein
MTVRSYFTEHRPLLHCKYKPILLFVVRITWNTWIRCLGKPGGTACLKKTEFAINFHNHSGPAQFPPSFMSHSGPALFSPYFAPQNVPAKFPPCFVSEWPCPLILLFVAHSVLFLFCSCSSAWPECSLQYLNPKLFPTPPPPRAVQHNCQIAVVAFICWCSVWQFVVQRCAMWRHSVGRRIRFITPDVVPASWQHNSDTDGVPWESFWHSAMQCSFPNLCVNSSPLHVFLCRSAGYLGLCLFQLCLLQIRQNVPRSKHTPSRL